MGSGPARRHQRAGKGGGGGPVPEVALYAVKASAGCRVEPTATSDRTRVPAPWKSRSPIVGR